MGGSDCEVLRDGWLAQPVNAWSSAAFLVASAYVLVQCRHVPRARRVPLVTGAVALALVAFGSAAFHGPQPRWADVAHDGAIATLLIVLVARRSGGFEGRGVAASAAMLAAAIAVLSVSPGSEVIVHAPLVAAVAVVELPRLREGSTAPSFALTTIGALFAGVVLLVLGRSGGPLCAPSSLAQAHAGWHVLSAVAAAALLAGEGRRRHTVTTSSR